MSYNCRYSVKGVISSRFSKPKPLYSAREFAEYILEQDIQKRISNIVNAETTEEAWKLGYELAKKLFPTGKDIESQLNKRGII